MRVLDATPLRSRYSTTQLLAMFQRLLAPPFLPKALAPCAQTFYNCAFNPLITLWYLMFQRVHADHTLEAVVTDAHYGGADALKQGGKPLSQRIRSWATAAYSKARQRLPLAVAQQGLVEEGRQIRRLAAELQWKGLWPNLLDGTTVRLRPHRAIAKEYPPQTNQHKRRPPYWCLMRVVVNFCARTGAALGCAVGSTKCSEQSLAVKLIWQAGAQQLFLGDRNLGIFRIVQVVRQVQAQALVRLTKARAKKLVSGGRLRSGRDESVQWAPSRQDQQEPGCPSEPVAGRLIVQRIHRPGFRPELLCLFTTLLDRETYPATELVELYGVRWLVELDLRYVKSQMEMAQLESKTPEMVQKEWWAGLMAYNLIRAVMLVAAVEAGLSPLSLSFSGARRQVEKFLQQWGSRRVGRLRAWHQLLEGVAHCRLPKRKKPRPAEPRAVRHLRLPYKALWGSRAQARRCRHKYDSKS